MSRLLLITLRLIGWLLSGPSSGQLLWKGWDRGHRGRIYSATKVDHSKFGTECLTDTPIMRSLLQHLVLHALQLCLLLIISSGQVDNGGLRLTCCGPLLRSDTQRTNSSSTISSLYLLNVNHGLVVQWSRRLQDLITNKIQAIH